MVGICIALALSLITSCSSESIYAAENNAGRHVVGPDSREKSAGHLPDGTKQTGRAKPKTRAESIHALVSHLGLGKGSVVADIGAGNGKDTWVFAEIVGKKGTVYAEEIEADKVKTLGRQAENKALSQVSPILGSSDDPCLPPNSVDLV